jgi:hypothetical protein
MIDLETMGTEAGCAILSIGAVLFDPVSGEVSPDSFYEAVSLKSCVDIGLTVDAGTVLWWMQQSDDARAAASAGVTLIQRALVDFGAWFESKGAQFLWCHGATFDAPIMSAAYKAALLPVPWKFWDVRDTRTIYDLANVRPDRSAGTHHNALDDAKAQALAVIEAYRKLGLVPTCAAA